jgi:hypothetical protein
VQEAQEGIQARLGLGGGGGHRTGLTSPQWSQGGAAGWP